MATNRDRHVLGWGIVLIVIGLIFLFDNLDFGIWDLSARLWPLILIFWGGWKLYFGLKERAEEADKTRE